MLCIQKSHCYIEAKHKILFFPRRICAPARNECSYNVQTRKKGDLLSISMCRRFFLLRTFKTFTWNVFNWAVIENCVKFHVCYAFVVRHPFLECCYTICVGVYHIGVSCMYFIIVGILIKYMDIDDGFQAGLSIYFTQLFTSHNIL